MRPDPTPKPRLRPASCRSDRTLVVYADRTRVIVDEHRTRVLANLGRPMVLVDGSVRATWKITQDRLTTTLVVEPFERLSKKGTAALTEEGARLLAFTALGADTDHVRFVASEPRGRTDRRP